MIDVRSEPMRQPELHLEPGAPAAMRGEGRYEAAAREACRVLRGGAEEAREGSDGGFAEPGECSVESKPVGNGRIGGYMVRWTDAETEFLRINYPTRGLMYCAEQLGKRPTQIRDKASRMGVKQDKNSDFAKSWQARAAY